MPGDLAEPARFALPVRRCDMTTTATAYWGARAAEYDTFIRRVVPRYDEMTARLLDSLPAEPSRVVELGCGTGNLSLLLADRLPGARFIFVDGAPEMVEATRLRLSATAPEVAERSTFLHGTFEGLELEVGSVDLVVASLSLHHVADLAPVYRMLARGMAPGGEFRSADGIRADDHRLHALHLERWEAFWREGDRLSPEEIASVKDHVARHDHYEPLSRHFRMLEAAGFYRTDCLWRDGLFGVMAAAREG